MAALRTIYNHAWGKRWPFKTSTISRTEVEFHADNALTIDANDPVGDVADQADFSDLPTQWSYTCLLHLDELMSTLHAFVHLPWRAPHILVVRDDYRFLMEELERLQGPYILTGQPGIGSCVWLPFNKSQTRLTFHRQDEIATLHSARPSSTPASDRSPVPTQWVHPVRQGWSAGLLGNG